jgi:protein gp37
MTDLFGEWAVKSTPTRFLAPIEEWLSETFYYGRSWKYMKKGCVYLWLTKRVENMMNVLQKGKIDIGRQISRFSEMACWARFDFVKDLMSNNYFGFTAEDQQCYSERLLPVYRAKEKWMQFWVSAEPLLGPLNLGLDGDLIPGMYQWLVVGCESGPNRRPCKIEWVESIVEQCRSAGVPVFVKQLDLNGKCERDISKFPAHLRIRQVPWALK